jgi:Na+/proline symporter
MVQRLLAARSLRESRASLMASWAVIFFQFALFLLIGVILFVYYGDTGAAPPRPADRIYPQFIWTHVPAGVAGLLIAAILAAAMSNLSAALNSLASTTIMDFYKPLTGGRYTDTTYLRLARGATVFWAVVLFAIGFVARQVNSVLEAGLTIASMLYGGLLGVFLLGLLTRHVTERAAIIGMAAGTATMLYVKFATPIAWTWYVLIGTAVTVFVGLASSIFLKKEPA